MRENVLGENPQLELRPGPQSVGRLHERGLVDSLLFTTKPAIPRPRPRPEEARPSICLILRSAAEGRASRRMGSLRMMAPSRLVRRSPKGEGGRTGHGRERCKAPMVRDARSRALLTMRSRCKSTMRSRLCKSPVFRLYYQENSGADACKCRASGLFFAHVSPVCVPVYRGAAHVSESPVMPRASGASSTHRQRCRNSALIRVRRVSWIARFRGQ